MCENKIKIKSGKKESSDNKLTTLETRKLRKIRASVH